MIIPIQTTSGQLTTELVVVEKRSDEIVFLGYRYSYPYLAFATTGVAVGVTAGIMTRKLIGATIIVATLFAANQIFKPKEL